MVIVKNFKYFSIELPSDIFILNSYFIRNTLFDDLGLSYNLSKRHLNSIVFVFLDMLNTTKGYKTN